MNRDCPEHTAAHRFMEACAGRLDVAIHTLLDNGVKELATRNTRDFEGFEFQRVFDPLAAATT